MSQRRGALLEALVDYVLRHGLAELSLRPMAAAVGTSARMLLFHFGSKERLVAALIDEIQARLARAFQAPAAGVGPPRVAPLLAVWGRAMQPEPFACLRLLYELQLRAARQPDAFGSGLRRASGRWLERIEAALPPAHRSRAVATLFCAVFDGLMLETLTTGDRRRTTQAAEAFLALVKAAPGGPEARPGQGTGRVRRGKP